MSFETIQTILTSLTVGISKHGLNHDTDKSYDRLPAPDFVPQLSSVTSALGALRWYSRVSRRIHPGITLLSLKRRVFFVLHCIRFGGVLRRWNAGQDGIALKRELDQWPEIIAFVERPYLNVTWSAEQRLAVLQTHYGIVDAGPPILRMSNLDRVSLLTLDHVHSGLSLVLDRPVWQRWEGEVVISLFDGEERIYLLSFTLGAIAGENMAYVGSVKGGAQSDMLDTYRTLTHELHGMRPRDLLFACFRLFCQELGIKRILAVSDAARLHRSPYLRNYVRTYVQMFSNYDDIWAAFGGLPSNGSFFDIGVPIAYRSHEQIPPRKRAQYRRRYEMLKSISAQIAEVVAVGHPTTSPFTEGYGNPEKPCNFSG